MHDTTCVLSCQRHPQKLKGTGVKMVQKEETTVVGSKKNVLVYFLTHCLKGSRLILLPVISHSWAQSSRDKSEKKTNLSSLSKQTPEKKQNSFISHLRQSPPFLFLVARLLYTRVRTGLPGDQTPFTSPTAPHPFPGRVRPGRLHVLRVSEQELTCNQPSAPDNSNWEPQLSAL